MRRRGTSGFTLAEVLVALAILGTALFILIGAHQSAMQLELDSEAAVEERQLLEAAVSRAEVAVMTGNLSAAGEFGPRYPGYGWSFDAQNVSSDGQVPLFQVTAHLQTPDGEKSVDFFYFDTGPAEQATNRADLTGKSSVHSGVSGMTGSKGKMKGGGQSSRGSSRGSTGSGRGMSRGGTGSHRGSLFQKAAP